ncbi:Lsr2 protein [Pseudonocardia thermophila]|jgi:Lsr2.|uniref:Lsr2 protein n=1 Tax=Pseudonocardia thermophila TaxID=1848 RepID=A0A1M6PR27_PSETH|nr:Lsr2 family protein [Pseudonocardia thermophila]SHK10318.1 Lsr2 protein [Pseudonocardia thermophila]
MAEKVVVRWVDDLSGEEVSENEIQTVRFGLDGKDYEIDLGPENAERLRGILGEFAAAARSGRSRRGGRAAKAPVVAPTRRRAEDTSGARAWLKANGYEVADRGRIPQNLIDIWRENKDKPQAPKKEAEKSDELDTSDAAILAWHKDKGYKVPESGKVNGLMRHRYLKEHKLA